MRKVVILALIVIDLIALLGVVSIGIFRGVMVGIYGMPIGEEGGIEYFGLLLLGGILGLIVVGLSQEL